MSTNAFLLVNVAIAFYNVGAVWAHEVDIFRSWKLIDPKDFHTIQRNHWHKLPYWVFMPIVLGLICGIVLISYRPEQAPLWAIGGALLCQILSLVLTAIFWGRWQAKLARDYRGPQSPYLSSILKTHWIRTCLISTYATLLLVCAIDVFR
jgi:hypothetical protein